MPTVPYPVDMALYVPPCLTVLWWLPVPVGSTDRKAAQVQGDAKGVDARVTNETDINACRFVGPGHGCGQPRCSSVAFWDHRTPGRGPQGRGGYPGLAPGPSTRPPRGDRRLLIGGTALCTALRAGWAREGARRPASWCPDTGGSPGCPEQLSSGSARRVSGHDGCAGSARCGRRVPWER
jgi:hypothetical protein